MKGTRYKTHLPNGKTRSHLLKSKKQLSALNREWRMSQDFDTKRLKRVARDIGLSLRAVYKWVWDRKRERGLT